MNYWPRRSAISHLNRPRNVCGKQANSITLKKEFSNLISAGVAGEVHITSAVSSPLYPRGFAEARRQIIVFCNFGRRRLLDKSYAVPEKVVLLPAFGDAS